MSLGLRVVRGPDWAYGDKDGGEGHVGTIINVRVDNSVDVLWDNGKQLICNVGKDGKRDLRVIDNAPAGIKHFGISCKECKRQPILGTRWKCCDCKDVNLCTICYFTDKHNLNHQFERYNRLTTTRPEKATKRSTSQRMRAFGIFPGAVVVRGQDWNYGKDDGGPGCKGNVLEIKSYSGDTGTRNAVKIKWTKGKTGEYRIGASGKVDIKCVEPGVGTDYYRDHLYIPDSSSRLTREISFIDAKPQLEISDSSIEEAENPILDTVLHVGDRVCVFLPVDELKEVQRGRGGWSMRMGECIGQIGKIKGIQMDEIVEVEYEGITWHFYQGALRKVYDIKKGDTVKVLCDPNLVERLQKGHGGWDTEMIKTCGKVGRVEIIDKDGDIGVQFGEQVWVYSPACLIPAPGQSQFILEKEKPSRASAMKRENTQDELSNSLTRLVAHLMILEVQQQQLRNIEPKQIVEAIVKEDIETVKKIIKMKKEMVNCRFEGLTPLMFASHGGNNDIVKILIENGADTNAKAEDGSTAVLIAASGKNEQVSILLIDNGASVHIQDKNKRNLAHHASYAGMTELLKKVLQKGCDPNQQDVEGDTALHDAIAKGHNKAVGILLGHQSINLTVTNNKDFSPIIFAAFKENEFATEQILKKNPDLINTKKKDGSTALQVAAVNDHREVAALLISKNADVDLTNRNGLTALHLACHEGYFEMAELLIENDADVDVQDDDGHTPLHLTLGGQRRKLPGLLGLMLLDQPNDESDRVKIACLLLNHDADIEIKDKNGRTPLQVCRSQRMKAGVENFTKQRKEEAARIAAAGDPFLTLLAALLVIPCAGCQENVANATFKPCGHKVVCEECSVRFDVCPKCKNQIEERFDQEGRRILENPCNVQ